MRNALSFLDANANPIGHAESRDAITDFLFIRDTPTKVDFAFVLGSPSISSIEPAIALFKDKKTEWIVISGHGPHLQTGNLTEAEVYKAYAISCGIPESQILIETASTNTRENFLLSHPLIEEKFGWKNITRVSISGKPFHMRRALLTAQTYWPAHLNFTMLPSNQPDDPPAESWWHSEAGRQFVFHELKAIGIYGLNGDLKVIPHAEY